MSDELDRVAKFELNLESLERNISAIISDKIEDSVINSIRRSSLEKLDKECKEFMSKNLERLVQKIVEEVVEEKVESVFNSVSKENKSLKEIIFGIMADKVMTLSHNASSDITKKLRTCLANCDFKVEAPDIKQGDILLKEIHTMDEDGTHHVEILFNNKTVFGIGNGEPEDMTLNRDLNDVFDVSDLLKQAYS